MFTGHFKHSVYCILCIDALKMFRGHFKPFPLFRADSIDALKMFRGHFKPFSLT